MNNEKSIVCSLIDYIESKTVLDFLALEVPFASGRRRADLVYGSYSLNETYAFEVKSDSDTLARLSGQLEDYRKSFNYVYVVTTARYLAEVKAYGLWFGIWIIDSDGRLMEVRPARKRKLASEKNYPKTAINMKLKSDLNSQFVQWLGGKYEPLYNLFKKERGPSKTTEKDIQILTLRSDRVHLL